ncbi:MAG: SAM-dependent methyltransferase, partial [Candidatus Iainarchaeum archaeon]
MEKPERKTIYSTFDKKTNLFYKLVACENDWNALEISGIQMHSYKHGIRKTIRKMVSILKPKGVVLDCCCGLGYLAILTAKRKSVVKVYSFEKDPNVIFLAKKNPFSKELFENKKIILKNEDVFEAIKKFKDGMFDCIFHDPPSIKIA